MQLSAQAETGCVWNKNEISKRVIVMKKKMVVSLFFCGITFLLGFSAYADTMALPTPYTVILDNGDKIFYMTPRGEEDEKHLKSGLYYNTEPPVNIYYINDNERFNINYSWGYFYNGNIFFSRDGSHFAYIGSAHTTGWRDLKGTAIAFYENGDLIKSYTVRELVRERSKVTFSVSSAWWEEWKEREHNQQDNTLTVTTKDGRVITFDITTGEIIHAAGGVSRILLTAIVISLIVLAAFVKRHMKKGY